MTLCGPIHPRLATVPVHEKGAEVRRKLLPTLLLLLQGVSIVGAQAQDTTAAGIVARIKAEAASERSQAMTAAFMLTDVFGPRLTGSPGFRRAGQWALEQLRGYGLTNVEAQPLPWARGWSYSSLSVQLVAPTAAPLIATPVAWSPPTRGNGEGSVMLLPLPKRGSTDSAQSLDAFIRRQRGQLRGKVILADVPGELRELEQIPLASPSDSLFAARLARRDARAATDADIPPSWTAVGDALAFRRWQDSLNHFLNDEGVLGLLYQSYYGRGGMVFEGQDGARTQPGWLADTAAQLAPPSAVLAAEHYLRLVRLIRSGHAVRVRFQLQSQFHADPDAAFNLLADIRGSRPDEVVLIGAHFDSWIGGTGATDNAAGAAVMMEAMRILHALNLQPTRTIRVALWGGHEGAGRGSRAYIRTRLVDGLSPVDLENDSATIARVTLLPAHQQLAAYFNMDFGGGRIRGAYLMKDERLRAVFQSWLAHFSDLNAAHVSSQAPGGSDHFVFRDFGLPAFPFIQDDRPWVHHSNMDLFDQLSETHLRQSAAIVAAFAYFAASRSDGLPRPAFRR